MAPHDPSGDSGSLPVWDEPAALAATGGDAALTLRLLRGLVEQLPADIDEMRRLAAAGDLPNLAEKAHRVRGGAVYCGVSALVAALTDLDLRARHGEAARIAAAVERVGVEAARVAQLVPKP